jgi:AraC-like DNA-binding protein
VLSIAHGPEQQPDELIGVCGWDGDIHWYTRGLGTDPLLALAQQQGTAVSSPEAPVTRLVELASRHVVIVVLREPIPRGPQWRLVISRSGEPFAPAAIHRCGLLLQSWHSAFVRPEEPGLTRALLGSDHRVLAGDLHTQSILLERPDELAEVMARLVPVLRQRYPEGDWQAGLEAIIRVAGLLTWARLQNRRVLPQHPVDQWYLEMRPVEEDELPDTGPLADDRIARAVGYLDTRFAESPSLAKLAKSVHMSRFHFHRLFSQLVGVSPKQYLLRRQLQMAKWHLRTRSTPINEIASLAGFTTHGHFTSTFHRYTGMSPSLYRERTGI